MMFDLILVFFVVSLGYAILSDSQLDTGLGAFCSGLALLTFIVFAADPQQQGYRQGQIDCMNGDIKYERVVNQDTVYKEID